MIANPRQPEHDPAAAILGEEDIEPKISVADRKRFMKTVTTAMHVLSKHPETRTLADENGKPIVREVVDDVELPEGEARIWLKVRPSPHGFGKKHEGDPVVNIIVAEKFDTHHKELRTDPVTKEQSMVDVKDQPVTMASYFSDGTMGLDYADSVEDILDLEAPPDDGSIAWYEQYSHTSIPNTYGYSEHVDNLARYDYDSPDPETGEWPDVPDNAPSPDFRPFEDVEPALHALADKV